VHTPTPAQPPPVLKGKHLQTLAALFQKPERSNTAWNEFLAMMGAAGAVIRAGGGSAHSFTLRARVLVAHRPHPGNEIPRAAAKRIRRFLENVGVRP
jgi:hypothetical protein